MRRRAGTGTGGGEPGSRPAARQKRRPDRHRRSPLRRDGLRRPSVSENAAPRRPRPRRAHLRNAFVTTSLCSPSRASILTGLYAHRHHVIDNNNPVPPGLTFFPQHLQAAGYETAFVGKWHMGSDSDAPQPGFDHWVSFKGQGTYWPNPNGLNVNGQHVAQKGYLTDELTDYAVEWLERAAAATSRFFSISPTRPSTPTCCRTKRASKLLVPASKARSASSPHHASRYANEPSRPRVDGLHAGTSPTSRCGCRTARTRARRRCPFGNKIDIPTIYRQYMETLLAVDDSVGRVIDALRRRERCSIPRSSSTWATTATPGASTA